MGIRASLIQPEYSVSIRQGFTLIELLVVTAIIGVIAAILLPMLARIQERSHVPREATMVAGDVTAEGGAYRGPLQCVPGMAPYL